MVETTYHIHGAPRLALLGDFHNGDPRPVLESLRRRRPDIICIAGDVVYGKSQEHGLIVDTQENILPFLRGCAAISPTFLSLGNHDSFLCREDFSRIRDAGVRVLDNAWCRFGDIYVGGLTSHYVLNHRVYFAAHPSADRYIAHGYDPDWVPIRQPDMRWLKHMPEGYKVLLCHHPEYYPILPDSIDLVLSAHAHGGQWRAFGHGLFAPGQGWFPKYTSGVIDNRLVVTRGLTNTTRVPRVNNPTEVVYVIS